MRRNQYQREVLSQLARIDSNLDKISKELARLVEQKRLTADAADAGSAPPDEWVQQGIDNIMSFQAGKKREVDR